MRLAGQERFRLQKQVLETTGATRASYRAGQRAKAPFATTPKYPVKRVKVFFKIQSILTDDDDGEVCYFLIFVSCRNCLPPQRVGETALLLA
jgi:hypothetical protein